MIKIPEELEREVETWGVDLQPLFLAFLRHEFDKIKRFESAVKESKSGSESKMQKVNPLHQPFTKDHHITLQSIKTPFFTTAT